MLSAGCRTSPAEQLSGWGPSVPEDAAEIPAVSRAQVERVMRHALGSTAAELGEWQWHSLPYHSVLPGRILARVTGLALVDTHEAVPWSSVGKIIRQTAPAELVGIPTGPREISAYP